MTRRWTSLQGLVLGCVISGLLWWAIIALACRVARAESPPVWTATDSTDVSLCFLPPRTDIERLVGKLQREGKLDELLRFLAVQGAICDRYGHQWKPGTESIGNAYIDPAVMGVRYRHCSVCGKQQSWPTEPMWRDE